MTTCRVLMFVLKEILTGNFTAYFLHKDEKYVFLEYIIWASSRENLSSGFPSKRDSNQSPQLQRQSRKLKFHQ